MPRRLVLPCYMILGAAAIFALGWLRHYAVRVRASSLQEWSQVSMSAVLVAACLFVILSKKYKTAHEHWASGITGLILGYWIFSII
jgi:hypothetical protein